jgi:hypothetical protein
MPPMHEELFEIAILLGCIRAETRRIKNRTGTPGPATEVLARLVSWRGQIFQAVQRRRRVLARPGELYE